VSLWPALRPILDSARDGRLTSVSAAVGRLDQLDLPWAGRGTVRFLRNFSIEGIEPYLKLAGYRRGLRLQTSFGDYDNIEQEILQPDSALHREPPDVVAAALWLDRLSMAFDAAGCFDADAVRAHVQRLIDQLRERTTATIAVNTFLPPSHAVEGWSGAPALADLNRELCRRAEGDPRLYLVDFERLHAELGDEQTFDRRFGLLYQAPLQRAFLALWAEHLAQAVSALKGQRRKVLVVDCDNTLWGGIVGEDGPAGIQLDPYEYPGSAFYTFQRQLLELERQGVLLALCSKNNEADVQEVLERHPHCLLRPDRLAAARVNWQDKAANLEELSAELNLGLDAFVFIDDNPVDCGRIRSALPMVETLALPDKPFLIPTVLARFTMFRGLSATAEDAGRTVQYHAERKRQSAARTAASLDDYLKSLGLAVEIGPATPDELLRVAQLTQKTNQFNLTTRRYSVGDIAALVERGDNLIVVMRVQDMHGDYGLTGLAIVRREQDARRIDTFLMSCRVLGRRVEDVLLAETLALAERRWGAGPIRAEYRVTPKNAQVRDFFDRRGFDRVTETETERTYALNGVPPRAPEPIDFIKITRR
jgi:FkbH-like protein